MDDRTAWPTWDCVTMTSMHVASCPDTALAKAQFMVASKCRWTHAGAFMSATVGVISEGITGNSGPFVQIGKTF